MGNGLECDGCRYNTGRTHKEIILLPDTDVLVVASYMVGSVSHDYFTEKNDSFVRSLLAKAVGSGAKIGYAYALRCKPNFLPEQKKYDVCAEDIVKCSVGLRYRIDTTPPRAILALGADALRALLIQGNLRDLRGSVREYVTSSGRKIPVIVTFHPYAVAKSPGLVDTMFMDFCKAFKLASGNIVNNQFAISTPTDAESIVTALEEMSHNIETFYTEHGYKMPVAVDTETTSLTPYRQDDRVIAVSLSDGMWKCMAFPFEHKQKCFSQTELNRIKVALEAVIGNPHVRLVLANAKFDTQWLKYRYGLCMSPISNDIILEEHLLDETKRGEYSLKAITKDRFPACGKYEEELHEYLSDAFKAKDAEIANLRAEYAEQVMNLRLEWWLDRTDEQRKYLLEAWSAEGFVTLTDCVYLAVVKRIRRKGEYVIPKKYQASVNKLLAKIPDELCEGLSVPEFIPPKNLESKTFEDAPLEILLKYAAIDAGMTYMILLDQNRRYASEQKALERAPVVLGYSNVQMENPEQYGLFDFRKVKSLKFVRTSLTVPLCEALADMEYYGVTVNREKIQEYSNILLDKMTEYKDRMYTREGEQFSLSASSPDLGKRIFGKYGVQPKAYTDKGDPSLTADSLKDLAEELEAKEDRSNDEELLCGLIRDLLVYRKLEKTYSTYLTNWLKLSETDSRIHCQFMQIGTHTYRLSSSSPNLQNIPFSLKEANLNLKSLFLPDSDEYELYELDVSNAEMRVLTAYSKDEALTEAFNQGFDLHCLTGSAISPYSYEDLKAHKEDKNTDQYLKRQLAKRVNFGVIYSMGAKTLQQRFWSDLRVRSTEEECQGYIDGFFVKYPGVKKYMDDTVMMAKRLGFVPTYTGHRRRFNMLKYTGYISNADARQSINARIQTTSSDLVMYNLIDVHNFVKQLNGRVLLTVHDSIVFQLPKGTSGVKSALDHIMLDKTAERAPWLPVKWKYDVGKGENYGNAHDDVN